MYPRLGWDKQEIKLHKGYAMFGYGQWSHHRAYEKHCTTLYA